MKILFTTKDNKVHEGKHEGKPWGLMFIGFWSFNRGRRKTGERPVCPRFCRNFLTAEFHSQEEEPSCVTALKLSILALVVAATLATVPAASKPT